MDDVTSEANLSWFTHCPGRSNSFTEGVCPDPLPYPRHFAGMKSIVELDHDELVDEELDEILDRIEKLESAIVLLADRMDELRYVADKLGAIAELLDTTKTD